MNYPALRECLAPQYADVSAEALDEYMDERFGPGAAALADDYVEGFFDDVGRAFRKAAPVIGSVASGAARGALSGSALGLPGIIGGAVLGGTGSALSRHGRGGTLRGIGQALNTGTQIAGAFSPAGRAGGGLGAALGALGGQRGAGGSAASRLMSLLQRPELRQALTALSLGPAGRANVPVGAARTPVPTTAITGLLQNLAAQAIDEAAELADGSEAALAYMADDSGEMVGDPNDDTARDARVAQLLDRAQRERLRALSERPPRRRRRLAACPECGGPVPVQRMPRRWLPAPAPEDADWITEDLLDGLAEGLADGLGEGAEMDADDVGEDLEAFAADVGEGLAEGFGESGEAWDERWDERWGERSDEGYGDVRA